MSGAFPITHSIRKHIVRILSTAYPQALSTPEVLAQLADQHGCNHAYRRNNDDTRYVPVNLPQGCNVTSPSPCPAKCWYSQAYPSLRTLVTQESVQRIPPDRTAGVRWRYSPQPEGARTREPSPAPTPDPDCPDIYDVIDLDTPPVMSEPRHTMKSTRERNPDGTHESRRENDQQRQRVV